MREEYVAQDGKTIDPLEKDKAYVQKLLIVLFVFLFVILAFFITRSIMRNHTCNNMIDRVKKASLSYAKKEDILPTAEGDFIRFSLEDLFGTDHLTKEDVTINEKVASGKIKITRYKKEYIVTVLLTKCSYCDSDSKKWSKELTKKPNKPIVDVITYYNYQVKSTNYTKWTDWFSTDKLKIDPDKTYHIRLPLEDNLLPVIPEDASIDEIEQENKEYYRYRDLRCKYYKEGGVYTDYFSSEKPDGYATLDENTMKYTEWTDYSLNYPEKKSYRQIETRTGYKWYYLNKKGKKVYYKNGSYAVEVISDKEYIKDNKAGSAQMYRYRDKQWRFYNGEKRKYSGYSASAPRGYILKDEDLCEYSSWSLWRENSMLTSENRSYRTEEVDTRYRYRIQYSVLSLPVFDKPTVKDSIEQKLEQDIDEILKRPDLKVSITYRFRVKK